MKRRQSTRRIKRTHRRSWIQQKTNKARVLGFIFLAGVGTGTLIVAGLGLMKFFGG